MPRFIRPPARNKLVPERLLIKARYRGICICKRAILPGDRILYDYYLHRAYCYTCGRFQLQDAANQVTPVQEMDEVQMTIDRINQLQALPSRSTDAERELKQLLEQLKKMAKTKLPALRFFYGKNDGHLVIAQYDGKCVNCRTRVMADEAVLWKRGKIFCSQCIVGS